MPPDADSGPEPDAAGRRRTSPDAAGRRRRTRVRTRPDADAGLPDAKFETGPGPSGSRCADDLVRGYTSGDEGNGAKRPRAPLTYGASGEVARLLKASLSCVEDMPRSTDAPLSKRTAVNLRIRQNHRSVRCARAGPLQRQSLPRLVQPLRPWRGRAAPRSQLAAVRPLREPSGERETPSFPRRATHPRRPSSTIPWPCPACPRSRASSRSPATPPGSGRPAPNP